MTERERRLEDALRKISAKQYENRETVSERTAWHHFKLLNQEVCEIYSIADDALKVTP